jgi:transposase
MSVRAVLPDLTRLNPEDLKALIIAQHAQILSQDEELLSKDEQLLRKEEQLASRDEEIERLKLLIAKLRWMQFGRKSEKLDWQIEQLELKLDELEASRAQQAAASRVSLAASAVNRARKRARRPLPAHLPRETHTVLPKQQACPDCSGALKLLGEDVSETLEYVPEHFKVIRQVRPKLACARCDKIVQAEAPSRPIERGIAGPGLLAHVLVSKYGDHLPLYRQAEIYARDGVELDRSTMAEWVGGCSRLLEPSVEALRRHVMSAEKLHADDTPVPVLAPGNGKTKTGRLWTYVRDDRPWGDKTPPAVWLAYTPDRKGETSAGSLEGVHGHAAGRCLRGVRSGLSGWTSERIRLHGAHSQALLRSVRGAQISGRERSAGADRSTVRHRGRDPRTFRRGAARGQERTQPAVAGIDEEVDGRDLGQAIEKIRHYEGDSLRPGALGRVDALLRRWSSGDRP